jgi:hypothetical protein
LIESIRAKETSVGAFWLKAVTCSPEMTDTNCAG